jgi:hypothetical protein
MARESILVRLGLTIAARQTTEIYPASQWLPFINQWLKLLVPAHGHEHNEVVIGKFNLMQT